MIKHKWAGVFAALLMVAAALAMCFVCLYPSAVEPLTGAIDPKYVSLMKKTEVMDIQIIADEAEWADMIKNATQEEYIPATVIINGDKIENVGIRPKGNSSLSTVARDDTTDRYSFKIEFDQYIDGQTWQGLDKIALNNMQGDASYMKEYLSYDIMEHIGVESPLYAFADIFVNGESWGFYLAVETLEDSYAQRVYGNDRGKLYKPENMGMRGAGRMNEFIENMNNEQANAGQPPSPQGDRAAQRQPFQQDQMPQGEMPQREMPQGQMPPQEGEAQRNAPPQGGIGQRGGGGMGGMAMGGVSLQYIDDDPSSYSAIFENAVFETTEKDHKRVIKALEKLSKGEDLENAVDVEAVLRYFAAHTVVVNLDSYISNMAHNYYLYEKDGRLTILPWDYNLAFGGFQSRDASTVVNFPIETPVSGVSLEDRPLLGKLLEVPEYMSMYKRYLREIVDGYFNNGLFESTVDSLDALISPYVEKDPSAFCSYEEYKTAMSEIKKLGLLRAESIEGQLDGTVPSTAQEQSAEPEKLIDVSEVNLSILGSQGGGIRGNNAGNNMGNGVGGGAGEALAERTGPGGGDGDRQRRSDIGGQWGGQMPPGDAPQTRDNPAQGMMPASEASGYDAAMWVFLIVCVMALLCGTAFVFLFDRRGN